MACYSEQTTSQLLTLNCQFVEQAVNSLVFEPLRRVCLRLMNLKRLCKYRVSRTSAFSVSSVNVSSLLHTQAEVFNTFLATFRPDNTTRTMHQQRSLLLGRSSCSSGFCCGALQVRSPWGARLKQVLGEVVELFPSLERRVYATIARPFRNCWSYTGFLWFDEVRSNVVGVCERQRFSEVLGRHKVSSCKIVFVYGLSYYLGLLFQKMRHSIKLLFSVSSKVGNCEIAQYHQTICAVQSHFRALPTF